MCFSYFLICMIVNHSALFCIVSLASVLCLFFDLYYLCRFRLNLLLNSKFKQPLTEIEIETILH